MNRTTRIISLLAFASLLGLACGVGQILPTATPAPTATPEPTPTPAPIYGIDEPAILSSVQLSCISGFASETRDVEVTLTGTQPRESIKRSGDVIVTPDSGNIFIDLLTSITIVNGSCLDLAAIAENLLLTCEGQSYEWKSAGLRVGSDGRLSGYMFTYEIPASVDVSACTVLLPDGMEIPLAPIYTAP